MSEDTPRRIGHEPPSVAVRPIVLAAAILFASVLGLGLLLYESLQQQLAPAQHQAEVRRAPIPPLPRLQVNAPAELGAMRAQQDALLSQYAWLDSAHTRARVPIARAMAIYAQQQAATAPPEHVP